MRLLRFRHTAPFAVAALVALAGAGAARASSPTDGANCPSSVTFNGHTYATYCDAQVGYSSADYLGGGAFELAAQATATTAPGTQAAVRFSRKTVAGAKYRLKATACLSNVDITGQAELSVESFGHYVELRASQVPKVCVDLSFNHVWQSTKVRSFMFGAFGGTEGGTDHISVGRFVIQSFSVVRL